MKQYRCLMCGFIYDEEKGLPDEGIPPGTLWNQLPDDWVCSDCGTHKDDFEVVSL